MRIIASNAQEASEIYCEARDTSGEGASTFPEGNWKGHRISYNGRVWQKDGKLSIYNPGSVTPDIWRDSTAPEALS